MYYLYYFQQHLIYSSSSSSLLLMIIKASNGNRTRFQAERAPLLSPKDDDVSSWGSSYDSVSHDEEDIDEWLALNSVEGKPFKDGDNNYPQRLCVICYDALRDCFFLPCGHCATCFTCGTRIAEEDGNCPICRRKMKKL